MAHPHHRVHQHRPGVNLGSCLLGVITEPMPVLLLAAALRDRQHAQQVEIRFPLLGGLSWLAVVVAAGGELDPAGRDAVEDLEEAVQLGRGV